MPCPDCQQPFTSLAVANVDDAAGRESVQATTPSATAKTSLLSSVSLMEGLRNLTTGYDRKFALSYCATEVWEALEAVESYLAVSDPLVGKAVLTSDDHDRYEAAEARVRAAFGIKASR